MSIITRCFKLLFPIWWNYWKDYLVLSHSNILKFKRKRILRKNINSSIGEKAFVQQKACILWVMKFFLNSVIWKHIEKNQNHEFKTTANIYWNISTATNCKKTANAPIETNYSLQIINCFILQKHHVCGINLFLMVFAK